MIVSIRRVKTTTQISIDSIIKPLISTNSSYITEMTLTIFLSLFENYEWDTF